MSDSGWWYSIRALIYSDGVSDAVLPILDDRWILKNQPDDVRIELKFFVSELASRIPRITEFGKQIKWGTR